MKRYLLIIGCLMMTVWGKGQNVVDPLKVSPVTPNTASLGKYGDIPVSLYTGLPEIQIPIYDIVVDDFHLPISLSYHASGIKVEEIPSWVGMGWTLNAGGMISRQMRGIQDERMIEDRKYFQKSIKTILNPNASNDDKEVAAQGSPNYDTESDIFYIGAGSLSQKFFLDTIGTVFCVPARKLRIQPEGKYNPGNNSDYYFFERWTVTDEKGVKYIFGKTRDNTKLNLEITQMNQICGTSTDHPKIVSSWYLSEIILPHGESITLTYDTYSFCIQNILNETDIMRVDRITSNGAIYYPQALQLKEIKFPSGKIEFLAGDQRRDIGGKVLDKIKIYSLNSGTYQEEKSYVFTTNNPTNNTSSDDKNFRLALLSVTEKNKNNEALPAWSFEYNKREASATTYNFGLPSRDSYAQDIWGYYNGREQNITLIPNFVLKEQGLIVGFFRGADRSVNSTYAQVGLLKKITYPTGGTTEFLYEGNVARGAIDKNDVNAVNPLINLVNMDVLKSVDKTNNTSLENRNGHDMVYGVPFSIVHEAGREVQFASHIMYMNDAHPCIKTTPLNTLNSGSFWECLKIELEKKDDSGVFVSANQSVYFDRNYTLFPGVYRIKLTWNDETQIGSRGYVDLSWTDLVEERPTTVTDNTELPVGGLRIAKITDYDPVTAKQKIRTFSYDYNEDDAKTGTSGTILDVPLHSYENNYISYINPSNPTAYYNWRHFTSFSNAPIFQTKGGYVGYKKVTVVIGENGEGGKSTSYFSSPEDYPDLGIPASHIWPFPSCTSFDWRRGLLEQEIQYKYLTNQSFLPIKKVINKYQFNNTTGNPLFKAYSNVKITKYLAGISIYGGFHELYSYKSNIYNSLSESYYLTETEDTLKADQGEITTTAKYMYNDQYLTLSSTEKSGNNGKITLIRNRYPSDISADIYPTMATLNMLNYPIEETTLVNNNVTGSKLTTYKANGSGYVTYKVYSLETATPLASTSFTAFNGTTKDSHYGQTPEYSFDSYDTSNGNPLKVLGKNGIYTYYVWAYNKTYPVAKIETTNNGISISQLQSNVGALTLSISQDRTLIDSDIQKIKTAISSGIAGNDQVTIYTYKPLVGLTSQTDPAGRTTYYEYDDFGRLKLSKNQDGNILKKYEYHYAGQ